MRVNSVYRTTAWAVVASAIVTAGMVRGQELFKRNGPFDLHIVDVRSIAPERRIGFGKSSELYAVTAYGPQMSYVLYCTKFAPESGRVYSANDEYVTSDLSAQHLWPVERSTLALPPGAKKKGRLYRVIIIQNVFPGPHPDIGCDIYSEKATQARSN